MAKSTLSLPTLLLFLLLLLLNSEGSPKLANAQADTWCIAKPSSSDAELTANIIFSCDQVLDCRLIQEGGQCFLPNTLVHHASVVMNLYYKMMGKNYWNCDFRNSGLLSLTDPSHDSCTYV
ncbi:glucan endo-1,3-beta-D-glucosidase-like [Juglans microcarpa x Juglans regia]|uniref:glucan endo-1,3-beta-D-glucosidase-like n=1 Tax=Juglans microcarpa x Juglans regia TaxID=2249226 RepID=UPI001B7F3BFB|nr:glucan endo-1,3-beta-D-glucosidase-like [Juglans microcarpa x Juglans regia]